MLQRPDDFAFFRPSAETILRCLSTRKSDIKIGTGVKPGLIGCDDFGWDSLLFCICIALEFIGLGAILLNRLSFEYALFGMLFAVVLDCLFAIWLHKLISGKSVRLRAEAIEAQAGLGNYSGMSQESRNAWTTKKLGEIKRRKNLAMLPALGIVLFCILKITAYAGLKGFRIDTVLFFLIVSYVVVAYIHLTTTGYWIAAVIANRWWNRDIQKYQEAQLAGKGEDNFGVENSQRFEVNSEGIRSEGMPPVMRGGKVVHEILTVQAFKRNDDGTNTPGIYELRCRGVLMDDEVRQLLTPVSMGANEVRLAIALRCMVYQLGLVQTGHEAQA